MTRYIAASISLACALALGGSPFTMVVLGDRTANAREEVFEQILQEVKTLKPDLLMNVGDLVEGYTRYYDTLERQWDTIVKLLRTTGVNYHLTPGNHDINDSLSEAVYVKRFGQPYYSFTFNDCHFTVIDNSRWDSAGAMPGPELAWLQQDLSAARGARWRFVFMHRSFWAAARRKGTTEKLHEIFKANAVNYVFSGHDHYYCRATWEGIVYTQLGPSGSRYKVYDQEERGAFQNYLLVNVSDYAVRLTVIKPGGVLPSDFITLDEEIQLDSIDRLGLKIPTVMALEDRPIKDSISVTVSNITGDVLTSRCVWRLDGTNWQVEPETVVVAAAPRINRTSQHHLSLAAGMNPYPLPELTLPYPYSGAKHYRLERTLPIQRGAICLKIAPPKIDGNLGDKVWNRLRPIRNFGASDGKVRTTEPFEVYLAHDDTTLYLAARCTESQMSALKADETERDGRVANDDNLNFLLYPGAESTVYYQIIVNPRGVIWDRKCWTENGKSIRDNKWNGACQIGTGRGEDFWTLEMALSLKEFPNYAPNWGLNIARFQARNKAVAVFQAPFAHDVRQMASLQMVATRVAEPHEGAGIEGWLESIGKFVKRLF